MIDESLIKFTKHATFQMKKRKINEKQVFATLNFPSEFQKGSHSNETIAIKYFGKKRVRVIYVSEPNELRVITVTH